MIFFLGSAKKTASALCIAAGLCLAFAAGASAALTRAAVTFRCGEGGTLTAAVDGVRIASGDSVGIGKNVVFTAVPAEGGGVRWWVNGAEIADSSYTLVVGILNNVAAVDVAVLFEPASPPGSPPRAAVTFGAAANGTLTAAVDGAPIASGDSVSVGKNVVFTAVPDEGYGKAHWTVNGAEVVDSSSAYTLVAGILNTASVDVVAFFDRTLTADIAVTFGAGANGALTATVDGVPIASGDLVGIDKKVVFTAVPDKGYATYRWTVNGAEIVDAALTSTFAVGFSKTASSLDVAVSFELFVAPVKALYDAVVTVGPNPVRAGGDAAIYWTGGNAVSGKLSVFDAVGDKVADINVNGVKKIGTWKVGDIAGGTYLIHGVLKDECGAKFRLWSLVGVVR